MALLLLPPLSPLEALTDFCALGVRGRSESGEHVLIHRSRFWDPFDRRLPFVDGFWCEIFFGRLEVVACKYVRFEGLLWRGAVIPPVGCRRGAEDVPECTGRFRSRKDVHVSGTCRKLSRSSVRCGLIGSCVSCSPHQHTYRKSSRSSVAVAASADVSRAWFFRSRARSPKKHTHHFHASLLLTKHLQWYVYVVM